MNHLPSPAEIFDEVHAEALAIYGEIVKQAEREGWHPNGLNTSLKKFGER